MEIPRRPFLHLAGGAAAAFAFSNLAAALDYPKRPVRFVVAFFAGSLSDILARSIAPSLSKHLGQEVIVDDQPGAGGNLATNIVVRASPDGYTLLEASPPTCGTQRSTTRSISTLFVTLLLLRVSRERRPY